jgi:DNA-binding transcriptional LysR family regulator
VDKLQAMRFFLKLSETLSFKRTAQHFGVPPSKVSRSIKALESELDVRLVERTTRQVRLTQTGEWYRNEVAGPLRALAAADELAEAQSREPTGIVRLTALPGYGEIRLFPVLQRFRAAHPRIVCDVELTDRYLDLSTGEIDVALRATSDPPDYLVARRLHSHRFVLVAAPGYLAKNGRPRRLADVEAHASIAYRGTASVLPWVAIRPDGQVVTVPRTPVLVTTHGVLILNACLAGEGLAFLPLWGVSEALAAGTLEEVTLDDARLVASTGAEMSLYMLYDPRKARLGKVRALVDFLTAELAEP